jgi:hypothetical protein
LLDTHADLLTAPQDVPLHLMIIRMGPFATALIMEAARRWRLDHARLGRIRITWLPRTPTPRPQYSTPAISCELVPATNWDPSPMPFTPAEVEYLAVLEHQRWEADRAKNGWRLGRNRDRFASSRLTWRPGTTSLRKSKTSTAMPYAPCPPSWPVQDLLSPAHHPPVEARGGLRDRRVPRTAAHQASFSHT